MQKLNLPVFAFRIKETNGKKEIFDTLRKKFVALTPEEWVRQNFMMYLLNEKGYPASLMAVESSMKLYGRTKRTDILIYNNNGKPLMIVECKAPEVKITESVFDQILRYNLGLNVNYLTITNGLKHYCCYINHTENSLKYLKEIPFYKNILTASK